MLKFDKELLLRLITGFALSLFGALLVYFSSYPYVINIPVAFLCIGSVYELYKAAGFNRKFLIVLIIFWIASLAISFITIPYYLYIVMVLYPFIITFFLLLMIKKDRFVKFARQRALLIPSSIVVILFHSLIDIRQLEFGFYYLIFAILVCVFTDIFAYLCGKTLGRHKMFPSISPKKTWEGSIGGSLSALILILLIFVVLNAKSVIKVNFPLLIIYTLILSAFSQFGDLSMSVIKRICGIKDFGKIFPGHGGVLDRFDSQLISVPLAYILCSLAGFIY
ncbi:MAG: phosphatidate cytidylyltransferase [Treponema sp.]|nr:phosphatidate cytidylyltransferase [Treponema sp.]